MCVIPFDRERPFPLRRRPARAEGDRLALGAAVLERALALALRENDRNLERARRAEEQVEALTAEVMRAQLSGPSAVPLARVG